MKHKNTSKWARRALKRGVNVMDDGTRDAIAEQLRLGQELRQKVCSRLAMISDNASSLLGKLRKRIAELKEVALAEHAGGQWSCSTWTLSMLLYASCCNMISADGLCWCFVGREG